ncbi:MAG: prepilin-type N-terminal cleavage/methylation domain-containing protein [Nannocystaceae bacterium]
MTAPAQQRRAAAGFTLLEVMIAVAILAASMTSLYAAQTANLQATAYARDITAIAFLADYIIVDVEWQLQKEGGWTPDDRTFEGDFSDQGWPEVRYACLVDFLEMPDYTELREAKDEEARAAGESNEAIKDAGDQAFSALGMVWPMVKNAIEQSIRKVTCVVKWPNGNNEYDEFKVETFWTMPENLTKMPGLGGEVGDEEEDGSGGAGAGQTGSSGTSSSSGPSTSGGARGAAVGGVSREGRSK